MVPTALKSSAEDQNWLLAAAQERASQLQHVANVG